MQTDWIILSSASAKDTWDLGGANYEKKSLIRSDRASMVIINKD